MKRTLPGEAWRPPRTPLVFDSVTAPARGAGPGRGRAGRGYLVEKLRGGPGRPSGPSPRENQFHKKFFVFVVLLYLKTPRHISLNCGSRFSRPRATGPCPKDFVSRRSLMRPHLCLLNRVGGLPSVLNPCVMFVSCLCYVGSSMYVRQVFSCCGGFLYCILRYSLVILLRGVRCTFRSCRVTSWCTNMLA